MFAGSRTKLAVRTAVLVALALLVWTVVARPSGAHGRKTVYVVQPYDTLWSIAGNQYGGDVRDAIWRIQQANHLSGTTIAPGERLVLP